MLKSRDENRLEIGRNAKVDRTRPYDPVMREYGYTIKTAKDVEFWNKMAARVRALPNHGDLDESDYTKRENAWFDRHGWYDEFNNEDLSKLGTGEVLQRDGYVVVRQGGDFLFCFNGFIP